MNGIGGTVMRGAGWLLATLLSLAVGILVAFGPIALLPGPLETDFVNGHWLKVGGMLFALAVMTWRGRSAREDQRFTFAVGAAFVRVMVSAFAMAIWPLVLLVWINSYDMHEAHNHDMLVTGIDETHVRPANTPIVTYRLRELRSSWSADLEMTDANRAVVVVGRCVRIRVVAGRLGLDWISGAQPIPCPNRQRSLNRV